jgi:hypothetical protein
MLQAAADQEKAAAVREAELSARFANALDNMSDRLAIVTS